ncbi:hypothetical protein [Burkholderia pseudomallei]|uniref:hypothetical protein n=1 Tax=Burkholderia pseudomallei TaxID=28450 RepID=UPI000173698D|nr:hypothetical protein [Burkholderia pseudomallei]EDU11415.1 hypothetical protein BURPS1655_F0008 [Burkholderia pseudomallei 1655]UZU15246.1 hypothetical protein OSB53_01505 [Burkholderia pseudomallei]UZU23193.1 hypothetical protein OSB35_29625 [Burkholderia pseudomallei]UZU29472.1 hypothetical protein OSB54_13875 [Burkholderia pseudomallei]
MRIEWRVNEIASCIVISFVAANRFSPASNVARAWHALSRRCVCAASLMGKREWRARTRFAANIGDARHAFVDCVNTETNDEPVISLRRVALACSFVRRIAAFAEAKCCDSTQRCAVHAIIAARGFESRDFIGMLRERRAPRSTDSLANRPVPVITAPPPARHARLPNRIRPNPECDSTVSNVEMRSASSKNRCITFDRAPENHPPIVLSI